MDELAPFSIQLSAVDPDLPAQTLTYDRVNGPEGLTVSPAGRVTWTPTEAQAGELFGGGARDGQRVPPLSDRKQFTVGVNEVPDPVVHGMADRDGQPAGRRCPTLRRRGIQH